MKFTFYKYHGTGNDFVILDNREKQYDGITEKQVRFLCERRFGVGSDGLMLLNTAAGYDFEMKYYNADGREGTMCGNGGRCLVQFAKDMEIHRLTYRFKAIDGDHEAEIDRNKIIRLKMMDVTKVEQHSTYTLVDTGSPHYIKFTTDLAGTDVAEAGKNIRYNPHFAEKGVNVNFVETTGDDSIFVRTYERGVEAETLSCGTGVTAASLMSAHNALGFNRVEVRTYGGMLSVEFKKMSETEFREIWLCGPATFVFKGEIDIPE